mgnify:CR=1 FL=1
MPNWKIHLEIAKRLNKKFNYTQNKLEEFYLGNILPDINNCFIVKDISTKLEHKYTHYQDEIEIPSYKNFEKIYKNKIYEEPIIFGYYIHLYTDYTWNNYFYTNFNDNEKLRGLSHEEKRTLKQDDFKVYNNLFIDNKPKFLNKENLVEKSKKIDRISINKEDIEKVEKFLDEQIKTENTFKILTKEILDKMMCETISHFQEK